ncbi:GNAT family N-acetyltransferase [Pseudovibrio sp. SPO723]|uniref:GNAT family N-acetyltransferase n=1 Tax=Nesiotobacter zosterae TaxID=392721 RepID=UPI0029C2DD4A|nr:GNAT family N-acetyltransferase [Pseudovibrio sp. SPO723]MDX5594077.1 GNAT family N-acetyltransferase [Pseudovibrio sp. SPO723]
MYEISSDKSRLDLYCIHHFLSEVSYWAKGIPQAIVARSIENSLCFGAYASGGEQVGFARVITDYATFGYLADVFVLPAHRGQGISKKLIEAVVSHPDLKDLRRLSLITDDAQGLYRQFGFKDIADPERRLDLKTPQAYEER